MKCSRKGPRFAEADIFVRKDANSLLTRSWLLPHSVREHAVAPKMEPIGQEERFVLEVRWTLGTLFLSRQPRDVT